jgi:hypothetical protein
MIQEGVVNITPEEERSIDLFLKNLSKWHNKKLGTYPENSDEVSKILGQYVNSQSSPKYKLNTVTWRFKYFPDTRTKAAFVSKDLEIIINLAHAVDNLKLPLFKQKIHFEKLIPNVYHEWVHFKQDQLYKKNTGNVDSNPLYKNKEYYDSPWEHMAFGRGEIEWIRTSLKKKTPKEILGWLKKWGLNQNDEISSLKRKNPDAYRKILKYAIMFALKKQSQEELKKS